MKSDRSEDHEKILVMKLSLSVPDLLLAWGQEFFLDDQNCCVVKSVHFGHVHS